MYRHLMVPLDDSALSAETAGKAVRLARTLGAEGHVLPRAGRLRCDQRRRAAKGDRARRFDEGMAGEARAILAKAEAVAREAGVSHRIVRYDEQPAYEAILDVAESRVAT